MGVIININLSESTQDEILSVMALLQAYDQAAIKRQIGNGNFETVVEKDAAIVPSRIQEAKVASSEVNSPAEDEAMDLVPQEPTPEPKKGRGRPRKDTAEKEVVPAEPAHVPTHDAAAPTVAAGTDAAPSDASAVTSSSAPSPKSVPVNADAVRDAFLKLQGNKGLQACLDLLKTFSTPERPIKRVAEIPEEFWAAAIEGCNG